MDLRPVNKVLQQAIKLFGKNVEKPITVAKSASAQFADDVSRLAHKQGSASPQTLLKEIVEQGAHKTFSLDQFYELAEGSLRQQISRIYRFDTKAMTHQELLTAMKANQASAQHLQMAESLLNASSRHRFAGNKLQWAQLAPAQQVQRTQMMEATVKQLHNLENTPAIKPIQTAPRPVVKPPLNLKPVLISTGALLTTGALVIAAPKLKTLITLPAHQPEVKPTAKPTPNTKASAQPSPLMAIFFSGQAIAAIKEKKLTEAEGFLAQAKKQYPKEPQVWLAEGDLAFAKKNYPAARQHYLKILKLNPRHDDALVGLGQTALFQHHANEAIQIFAKVKQTDVRDQVASAYNLKAIQIMQKKQWGAAVPELKQAAKYASYRSDIQSNLGTAYFHMQQWSHGIQAYEKFLQLAPNDPQAESARELIEKMKLLRDGKVQNYSILPNRE